MNIPKPKFNKKLPKNAKRFLLPDSDDKYKATHPTAYRILELIGIAALMLPSIIFIICMIVFDIPDRGWLMLSLFGTFIIGCGLFNIVGAWIGQYLGHKVTIGAFASGTLLLLISLFLLYSKSINKMLSKEIVDFYLISLLILFVPAIIYFFFRMTFFDWIVASHKIRVRDARKMKKGFKNFWFYEALHRELKLGPLYYVNKIFLYVYPASLILSLFTGLIRVMSIPIFVLSDITYILCAVMTIFSQIQLNKEFHGKPFVIFARSRNKGIDSVFFDILFLIFILGGAYTHTGTALKLWGINLP